MRKNIMRSLLLIVMFTLFILISINQGYVEYTANPTATSLYAIFSIEADRIFNNTAAKDIDLNTGITMERALPLYDEQINNITFAVFNHTNESIIFSSQGFDLAVFRYDETVKIWENLKLPYTPYPETTTLLPKVESWSSEDIKSWTLLEEDTTSFGYKHLRLYVLGRGEISNKYYGAYLDVMVSIPP